MARKKEVNAQLKLDANFKVLVPDELKACFQKDLKRGELSLSIDVELGSVTMGNSIYPNDLKDGGVSFEELKDGFWEVSVKGSKLLEMNPEYDQDFIDAMQGGKTLPVVVSYVGDNDSNEYYIEGSESKKLAIGSAQLQ